ncbi:MAG: alpha-L-arabinofuranosidase family protein [Paenibacillaceae bacterium]|nr:alpha-L-arabinofuranosidase family protein [Paenibacillaceae bacterium]
MLARAGEHRNTLRKSGKMAAAFLMAGVLLLSSAATPTPWPSRFVEAASSEAWIEVNTDSPTLPMPAFGFTYSYDRNGQSLVDDAGLADPVRQAALNEIRPQWIRFPGSAIANTYDWTRAIGPQNERIRNVDGRIDRFVPVSSAFGPDEAAALMEQVGGTLVMTVPFNSSAQDAADLVEYMNAVNDGDHPWAALRADNGHPLPYGVKYWTVAGDSSASAAAIWTAWPTNGDDIARNGIAPSSDQAQTWWSYGGERSFTNQKAVRIDSWRDAVIQTQGIESETYYVKFPPAVPESVSVKIGATPIQAQSWTQVDDFSGSSSDSMHYLFDAESGKITFGDGVHGAIPPMGQFVYVDYVSGPHDSYHDFYSQMKLADPNIVITSDNLILRNMHTADPELVPLDGIEVRSGDWFADSNRLVNDNYFDEAIGRGYGAFKNTIDTELAKMDKPSIEDVKLALTDVGYSQSLQDAYGNDYAQTMAGALMRSLMLAQASLNGRVPWVGSAGLFANLGGAADDTGPNEISAQEYAVQMFTTHFGSKLLRTTNVGSAERIVKYWKDKGAVSQAEVPGIVALASESTDESTAYVMLINTTRDDDVAARIAWRGDRLAGFVPIKTWVLDADSLSESTLAIRSIDPPSIDDGVIRLNTDPASITVIELRKNAPE